MTKSTLNVGYLLPSSIVSCASLCRIAYTLLVGKPEGKRPLGRPRSRWVDNIRMDLGEVGWGDMEWIGVAQDRNRWRAVCEFGIEPTGSMKCWEAIEWPLD
jgi:hypothetical protein